MGGSPNVGRFLLDAQILGVAMKTILYAAILVLIPSSAFAADAKKADDKDPLAEYSDDERGKIDFCFNKFFEAVAAKDAKTAAALLSEMPKNLAKLDLSKEDDKATFLKAFASMSGASAS